MRDVKNGGPAFPFEYHNQTRSDQPGFFGTGSLAPGASQQFSGMTLRDYFAAKALEGQMAAFSDEDARLLSITNAAENGIDAKEQVAIAAYEYADAMLKARQA